MTSSPYYSYIEENYEFGIPNDRLALAYIFVILKYCEVL